MGHKHRPHNFNSTANVIRERGWGGEGKGTDRKKIEPPPPPPHLTFSDASPKGCYLTILTSSFSPPIAPLPLPRHSFFLLLSQFSWRTSRGNACYAGYSANAGVSQQCPPKTKRYSTVRSFRSFYVQDWKLWQKFAGKMLINISEKRQQQK